MIDYLESALGKVINKIQGRDYEQGDVLRASRKRLKQFREHLTVGDRTLEIGTGSGVIAKIALEKGAKELVAVDINPAAVAEAKRLLPQATVLESDLFEKVQGVFDTIIFAPPWSEGEIEDYFDHAIYDCGVVGRFLQEATTYLAPHGRIWIQYSDESATNHQRFLRDLTDNGYRVEQSWSYLDWAILTGVHANIILYEIAPAPVVGETSQG